MLIQFLQSQLAKSGSRLISDSKKNLVKYDVNQYLNYYDRSNLYLNYQTSETRRELRKLILENELLIQVNQQDYGNDDRKQNEQFQEEDMQNDKFHAYNSNLKQIPQDYFSSSLVEFNSLMNKCI